MAIGEKTGTETYSDRIIRGLISRDGRVNWRVFLNLVPADPLPHTADIRIIPARRLWTHGRLSRELLIDPPDLLFVPSHVVPVWHPRTVVTIHDVGYIRFPGSHPRLQRIMLELSTRWSCRAAQHIIVPSRATADDVMRELGVSGAKMTVVPHGVDERFRQVSPMEARYVCQRYALNRQYVVAVGTIQPRKNLVRLARAVSRLVDQNRDIDLVIAGKPGWMAEGVVRELQSFGLGDRLHILHYVPDLDLPAMIKGAACLAQPSFCEGFGLPVLEAMAAGTPVAIARGSSLPEIARDTALYFDPFDVAEMANQIDLLITDQVLGTELAQAGEERSRMFSWTRSVNETMSVLLSQLPKF